MHKNNNARKRTFAGELYKATMPRFEARGFQRAGQAHASPLLPAERRARVNAARNSQLFVKEIVPDCARSEGGSGRDRLAGAAL